MTVRYTERYERIKFNTMEELMDKVTSLPDAEIRKVHVEGINPINEYEEYQTLSESEAFWTDQKYAVVNSRTNSLAQIVSPGYKKLDHADFGAAICDKLQFAGTGNAVKGYMLVKDGGNDATIRMIFDDVEIQEPGMGRNIKVGCEFSNSYDTSWAAKGRAFFLRMSCTNQMVSQNLIPECVFSKSHVAASEMALLDIVDQKIDWFIKAILDSGAVFEHAIEVAYETEIEFAHGIQLDMALQNLLKVGGKATEIAENAMRVARKQDDKYHITAWELYNEISDYTTHTAMSPNIFDKILVRGEKLLTDKLEIPALKVPVQGSLINE